MNRCFDAFIRRFSMFKGESTLNVFQDKAALKQLVDKFSDVRKFDELVKLSAEFEEKSNKAFLKECSTDKKISGEAKSLELKLERISSDIFNKKADIKAILPKVDATKELESQIKEALKLLMSR